MRVTKLLLAHGAGAPMDSTWMEALTARLRGHHIDVRRFEFPYMAARRTGKRKPPDRMPVLLDTFRAAYRTLGPCFIGGKSLGGRVTSMLADELEAFGIVCFGYPFVPPAKGARVAKLDRTAHLRTLQTPALILQGTRDPFGGQDTLDLSGLAPEVAWLEDGDHDFEPRKRSGLTLDHNLDRAAALAAAFIQRIAYTRTS